MKKKLTGLSKLSLSLLFMLLFVGSFTTSNAVLSNYLTDYQMNTDTMQAICETIGIDNYYSGDYLTALTDNFNLMMRTVRARGAGHDVVLGNCMFTRNGNTLKVWFDNSRTLDYGFIESGRTYIPTNSTYPTVQEWNGWNYNSNNQITGVVASNMPHWTITNSSVNFVTSALSTNNMIINEASTYYVDLSGVTYLDTVLSDNRAEIFTYNSTLGYREVTLKNVTYINLGEGSITPTPVPTGSGGGGSGGGSSTDLTQTNNLISNVDSTLNNAFDSNTDHIDSGDIGFNTSDYGINDPTSNFFTWVLNEIQTILTTNQVETITFDFLGTTHTIRSDFFVMPSGPVRIFLVAYYTFITGFMILKDVRATVEKFKNGNIEDIGKDDINANIV